MNDYKNNGDATEVFGRHPLYVKPETVARFRPKYLGYALTERERASLVKRGLMNPNAELEARKALSKAKHDAWNVRRLANQRIARKKKREGVI